MFFTGQPLWPTEQNKLSTIHPMGHYRIADQAIGSLKWVHEEDEIELPKTGHFWWKKRKEE